MQKKDTKPQKRSKIIIIPKFKGKNSIFAIIPVIPHLLVIAACIGLYYAMMHFYFLFEWGFYIYYAVKVIIAFTILASALRSLMIPLLALLVGLTGILGTSIYTAQWLTPETSWQLIFVAVIGILVTFFVRL